MADQPNLTPIAGRESTEPLSPPREAAVDLEQAALEELKSVVAELLTVCMDDRVRSIR